MCALDLCLQLMWEDSNTDSAKMFSKNICPTPGKTIYDLEADARGLSIGVVIASFQNIVVHIFFGPNLFFSWPQQ